MMTLSDSDHVCKLILPTGVIRSRGVDLGNRRLTRLQKPDG